MLKYNLTRLFMLKGISKPTVFLVKAGFSRNIAARLTGGRFIAIPPKNIERLCLTLKCTPNDLMEWEPAKPELLKENQPLSKLVSNPVNVIDMRDICSDIPYNMLSTFAEKIHEVKKEIISHT